MMADLEWHDFDQKRHFKKSIVHPTLKCRNPTSQNHESIKCCRDNNTYILDSDIDASPLVTELRHFNPKFVTSQEQFLFSYELLLNFLQNLRLI